MRGCLSETPRLMVREAHSVEVSKCIYTRLGWPRAMAGWSAPSSTGRRPIAQVLAFCKISETRHPFARLRYVKEDGLPAFYSPDFPGAHGGCHLSGGDQGAAANRITPMCSASSRPRVAWCERINALTPEHRRPALALRAAGRGRGLRVAGQGRAAGELLDFARLRPAGQRIVANQLVLSCRQRSRPMRASCTGLLSQQMVQNDAMMATLVLLQPSRCDGSAQRRIGCSACLRFTTQILAALQRSARGQQLAGGSGHQPGQRAGGLTPHWAAHSLARTESGRRALLVGAGRRRPSAMRCFMDLRSHRPHWSEWPMDAKTSPVRVVLEHEGQPSLVQPGRGAFPRAVGSFDFHKHWHRPASRWTWWPAAAWWPARAAVAGACWAGAC
jgi:hypothetical protein